MSDNNYNVVLTGELLNGVSQEVAIKSLASLFKIDEARAEATFNKAPVIIKRNASEEKAHKMQAALQKVGLRCAVKSDVADPEKSISAEPKNFAENTSVTQPSAVVEKPQPESFQGWEYSISGDPDYAFLKVNIPGDETLKVEASSMATMDTHVKMKTRLKGGVSRFLSGESLFINEFTAQHAQAEIGIAPGTPGDMAHEYLDGDTIYLQNSAFVAATMGIDVETKWQGLTKGFFSGESLFLIRCSGVGDLWFNTYGSLIEIDVNEDYVVDTGNIVAFTEGLDYRISKVGGYKSLFFSGEGFVCRFSGQGKVWIQTRGAAAFTSWAHWFRPVQKKS